MTSRGGGGTDDSVADDLDARAGDLPPPDRQQLGGAFLRGGARPPVEEVIRFIDEHQDRRSGQLRWGIERIAKTLGIAPSTYHAAKKRAPSARAVRDVELRPQILRVWEQNLAVYGADKVWHHLNHEDGVRVARCTVERLMADMGLQGCRRGRVWIRTTEGDDRLDRPADLVERQFRAPAPNRLWVADLTDVKTHSGWVYVAFIVDVFSRMVVGWQASRSLRSRSGDRRSRDGRIQPTPCRSGPVAADASQRPRNPIPQRALLPSPRRQLDRRVGRLQGRLVRQRDGRIVQRALQVGADLPERPLARPRRRRVRDPHLPRLVQPSAVHAGTYGTAGGSRSDNWRR